MNALRNFIRESLMMNEIERVTWGPERGKDFAEYGKKGASKAVSDKISKLIDSASRWRRSGVRQYRNTAPRQGRVEAVKAAWQAGGTGKWKVAAGVATGAALLTWAASTWWSSKPDSTQPTDQEADQAVEQIDQFYNSLTTILQEDSTEIRQKFRTDEIARASGTTATLDTYLERMRVNYNDASTRLTSLPNTNATEYERFFITFPEFEDSKSRIDSKIEEYSGRDTNKEAVLKTYAVRYMVYSAANEIIDGLGEDSTILSANYTKTTEVQKIESATRTISEKINTAFSNDNEIKESFRMVDEMSGTE